MCLDLRSSRRRPIQQFLPPRFLQAEVFKRGPLTDEGRKDIRESLSELSRRLTSWLTRFEREDEFEYELYEEMLSSVSEIGYHLLEISYYPLDWMRDGLSKDLQEIGIPLHLIEQAQGSASMEAKKVFLKAQKDGGPAEACAGRHQLVLAKAGEPGSLNPLQGAFFG